MKLKICYICETAIKDKEFVMRQEVRRVKIKRFRQKSMWVVRPIAHTIKYWHRLGRCPL